MTNHSISPREFSVLKSLIEKHSTHGDRPVGEIAEIAVSTGIRDSQEVQRVLYWLEGKNLVQPDPVGDFTSNRWKVTPHGIKAFQLLEASY